jgi:hypothetical protein
MGTKNLNAVKLLEIANKFENYKSVYERLPKSDALRVRKFKERMEDASYCKGETVPLMYRSYGLPP